jgi:subfamily B ATP-binding cassette protein MsbA
MSLYRRLLELVKPYWFKLALAMTCMVLVALLTSLQAFLVRPVFDGIFLTQGKSYVIPPLVQKVIIQLHLEGLLLVKGAEMLRIIPIAIVFLFLLKGIFNYGQVYLMNFVGLRIIADVREKLYNHLQTLSLSFFTKTPTSAPRL